jgi:hypothetical protein
MATGNPPARPTKGPAAETTKKTMKPRPKEPFFNWFREPDAVVSLNLSLLQQR